MIVPMFPVSATEESVAQPTIEEILNSYHQKAFDAQTAEENGGASTYARSGSGSSQTPEQETVAELTAAGYEAYNVTSDNYDALEETLNTDFADLGLDANGSYVVVISGENSNTNSNARVVNPNPEMEQIDPGNGSDDGSYSFHSENGHTYKVRQITVTAADDSNYATSDSVDLLDNSSTGDFIERVLNHIITSHLDTISDTTPWGTILGLLGVDFVSIDTQQETQLTLYAGVSRTRIFTQIFDEDADQEDGGTWITCHSTESARVYTEFYCLYYDTTINGYTSVRTEPTAKYFYGQTYLYVNDQNEAAIENLLYHFPIYYHECVGDIYIYLTDESHNTQGFSPILTFLQPAINTP